MTRKEIINAIIKATMTEQELTDALASLEFGTKVYVSKQNKNVRNIYDAAGKTKYASVEIVEAVVEAPKKKTKKARKTNNSKQQNTARATKESGNGYVVYFALKTDEEGKIQIDDTMTTCKEIKAFIKKLHSLGRGCVSTLNIYKMGENYQNDHKDIYKTRISAWVGPEFAIA